MPPLPPTPDGDLALVRRALAGDAAAREELAGRLSIAPRLVQAQNRRLGKPLGASEVDDVAQEAVLAMLRKLDEFEGRATLETLLYRYCYLQLMNAARRRVRRKQDPSVEDIPEPAQSSEEAPDTSALEPYLKHLSPREGDVVRLRHVEGLEFREIAELLDVSASSAKSYHARALEKLRALSKGMAS